MQKRDTFNYALRRGSEIVYYGTAKNLAEREAEHRNAGKVFDTIRQIGEAKTEAGAKEREAELLSAYRRSHGGRNPLYNKTNNG